MIIVLYEVHESTFQCNSCRIELLRQIATLVADNSAYNMCARM